MPKLFPYKLSNLTWIDEDRTRNKQNVYCYCGKGYKNEVMLRCDDCGQLFHQGCVKILKKPLLHGDDFFSFTCSVCTQGIEKFERIYMSWVTMVHLILYNLIINPPMDSAIHKEHPKYFRLKEDICKMIENYWEALTIPHRAKSATWPNSVASCLSTHLNLFQSGIAEFGSPGWWTLKVISPPNKGNNTPQKLRSSTNEGTPRKRRDIDVDSNDDKTTSPVKLEGSRTRKRQKLVVDYSSPLPTDGKSIITAIDFLHAAPSILFERQDFDDLFNPEQLYGENENWLQRRREAIRDENEQNTEDVKQVTMPDCDSTETISEEDVQKTQERLRKIIARSQVLDMRSYTVVSGDQASDYSVTTTSNDISTKNKAIQRNSISEESSSELATTINLVQQPRNSLAKEKKLIKTVAQNKFRMMSHQEEWTLLQKLENTHTPLSSKLARLKRKLALRRYKLGMNLKLFDLDDLITMYFRSSKDLVPLKPTRTFSSSFSDTLESETPIEKKEILSMTKSTLYVNSFARRLHGVPRLSRTVTANEAWMSPYHGRKLRPYIRRDWETLPARVRLLNDINSRRSPVCIKLIARSTLIDQWHEYASRREVARASIDYVYFQKAHLAQVNALLCKVFWPSIDVSENLQYPDFSIIALYKYLVIGCAFMTPEGYVTYIAIESGWENAGIGQFMLYHLIQTAIGKDLTLHVSANNPAMILYQKFGFKPEGFIVDFYNKYLPKESSACKNATFLRLRR